jgi:2-polyprenyl-6-methoxyphenol hydroxylase-like FAD-dependent oxidoreductase
MADSARAEGIVTAVADSTAASTAEVPARGAGASDYDAAIVGASLAGCTTAILLAKAGARVALIEQRPDANAFKQICTHYIQSSAVPTLERLGLLERMMQAGALRGRGHLWTRWGWIEPPAESSVPMGVNLRRERLDPLIRRLAAETPGVELILGYTVRELLREGRSVCGLRARDPHGETLTLRARLIVGADGRDSRVAKLAELPTKTKRHGRFAYGAYFEGPRPATYPHPALWLLDPDMAAAFPTDGELTLYAVMPSMERLPEFRADPAAALKAMVASVPEAPPILASRLVGEVKGKIDMTTVTHVPTAPGLALAGDAAGTLDPLWGVGCGFAFQSAEWLADSVIPAISGAESLEQGLERYRRRYARRLRGHTAMITDYSSARKLNPAERILFSAATRNERIARTFEAFGSRNIGPARMLATALPRAIADDARHRISRRAPQPVRPAESESA